MTPANALDIHRVTSIQGYVFCKPSVFKSGLPLIPARGDDIWARDLLKNNQIVVKVTSEYSTKYYVSKDLNWMKNLA